jgi:hypothetical protein
MSTPSGCTLNTGTLHCARPSAPSCDPEIPPFERVKCGMQAPRLAMGTPLKLPNEQKKKIIPLPGGPLGRASIPHRFRMG